MFYFQLSNFQFFSCRWKLKIISDSRIFKFVSKGPLYRFPCHIDSNSCREYISSVLNDFGNQWCKQEVLCVML